MTTLNDYRIKTACIPWFREEDYPAILTIMENAHEFLPLWEDWLKRTQEFEDMCKGKGYVIERVNIDPRTFPDWCRINKCRIDSKACDRFAIETIGTKHNATH